MSRLILASSSPRRQQLLTLVGLSFEIARPDIDETPLPDEPADHYVIRLSQHKSRAIKLDGIILTADTTVADGDHILGKPDSPDDAAAMLRRLRNRSHVVHTAITVRDSTTDRSTTHLVTSWVFMRNMNDDEIAAYVASGDPMGKAGSYAIQNVQFHPVDHLEGCYTNVVGLPICIVLATLAEYGIQADKPLGCSPHNLPCQFMFKE